MSDEIYDAALPIIDAHRLPPRQPGVWFCRCGAGWVGEASGYPDDLRRHAVFRVDGGELGAAHDPGSARFRPDAPAPTADAAALDPAWAEAEAALPEGYDLVVGHTSECRFCAGWWATASKRNTEPPYYPHIVSSETDRPRGEHHDPTPADALRALAVALRAET